MDVAKLPIEYRFMLEPSGMIVMIAISAIASVISAFVIKALIQLFGLSVKFAFVWGITLALTVFSTLVTLVMGLYGLIPDAPLADPMFYGGFTLVWLIVFALVSRVLVYGDRGEPVPGWKWFLAGILQYVVYAVIAVAAALIFTSIAGAHGADWGDAPHTNSHEWGV